MDASAIKQIQQAELIKQIHSAMESALGGEGRPEGSQPIIALPADFQIHNLEKHLACRTRYRGTMAANTLQAFLEYVNNHSQDGQSAVFIDEKKFAAKAIINLGDADAPGHCDHVAVYKPDSTPEFRALCEAANTHFNQRDMIEWLEDWVEHLGMCNINGEDIGISAGLAAIRKLTIESIVKSEHTDEGNGAKRTRSRMESIEANSIGAGLPSLIHFRCEPYNDFTVRTFELRFYVVTSHDEPMFKVRIKGREAMIDSIAEEFVQKINSGIANDVPAFLGTFEA